MITKARTVTHYHHGGNKFSVGETIQTKSGLEFELISISKVDGHWGFEILKEGCTFASWYRYLILGKPRFFKIRTNPCGESIKQEGLYPLSSRWESTSGARFTLDQTMKYGNIENSFDYLNPKRIGFIFPDKRIYISGYAEDPLNITEAEFKKLTGTITFSRVSDLCRTAKVEKIAAPASIIQKVPTLCILCIANPLRRDCACLGKLTPRIKKTAAKINPILIRKGWDNILIKNRLAYLHADSNTVIRYAHKSWSWTGDCNPKTGKRRNEFAHLDDAEALMKRVEDILGCSS